MITIKSMSGKFASYDGDIEILIKKFIKYSNLIKSANKLNNDNLIVEDLVIDLYDILFTTRCLITDFTVWLPNDLTIFWSSVDPDMNYSITDENGSIIYERK
jgi:hypothetical protein